MLSCQLPCILFRQVDLATKSSPKQRPSAVRPLFARPTRPPLDPLRTFAGLQLLELITMKMLMTMTASKRRTCSYSTYHQILAFDILRCVSSRLLALRGLRRHMNLN